ncbi:hypothetical protein H5410_037045 [Solanum commersonii]|uniref:Uncharacterized protein n=1 Tax=Solanum commersonii TaxID=4109 RepID=A0A9J5Y6N2_SOLCO|nr:hypothetical protein H5410_037045 [Solanum commersonii]
MKHQQDFLLILTLSNDYTFIDTEESLELKSFPYMTFIHLREVKVGNFIAITFEMQFINLI